MMLALTHADRNSFCNRVGLYWLVFILLACKSTFARPFADKSQCTDTHQACKEWVLGSQCIENPWAVRPTCAKSCGPWDCGKQLWGSRINGHVTEGDTRHFATQFKGSENRAPDLYQRDVSMGEYVLPGQKLRGDPWLSLSSIGVGTYLGEMDDVTDEAVVSAILASVYAGWNIIDTASNYRLGHAEKSVGEALKSLESVRSHGVHRPMIFVSTKAGFIADEIKDRLMGSKVINSGDLLGGSNCFHPECIKASLTDSLRRMRLETVDLLYLHNVAEMGLASLGKTEFFARLKMAFETLEELRAAGSIQAYGMATWNCFREAPGTPQHLSLEEVVHLAADVGGPNHGFRYIQLPINVAMREAWEEKWQTVNGSPCTVLEAAAKLGVGTFASGPLMEAKLMQQSPLVNAIESLPELSNIEGLGPKLLQLARSTPLLTAALIGHKSYGNVKANLELSEVPRLSDEAFHCVMKRLKVHTSSS